jgi:nucleoside-diphosphate-sugar epimerase
MRVALTGASGFVGGAIARKLREDGHGVVALTRRETSPLPGGVHRVLGDLADPASLSALTAGAELVIHAAGLVRSTDVEALRIANVEGTVAVARALGPDVPLVHVSTAGIYGLPHRTVDEFSPWSPPNEYERSKAEAERRLREVRPDANVIRPTNILGVGHPSDPLLRFMRHLRRGSVLGSELAAVNYVSVDRVAAAAIAAGIDPAAPTQLIINEPMRFPAFAGLLGEVLGVHVQFRSLPGAVSKLLLGASSRARGVPGVGRIRAIVDPMWIDTVHRPWLDAHCIGDGLRGALRDMTSEYRRRGLL